MRILFRTILWSFIFLTTSSLYALNVDENTSDINILKHSEIFVDETNSLTIDDVVHQAFVQNSEASLSYGFDVSQSVWVKFTLQNSTDHRLEKTLEYATTLVGDIYVYDGENVQAGGRFHIGKDRNTLTPSFHIFLEPYEKKTIYVKAYSKLTALIVKLTLWDRDSFIENDNTRKIVVFSFFAAMLILFIYNFMLWIFTRQKVYFYYILYLFGVMFFQANYVGLLQLYLFSNDITILVEKASSIHISFLILSIVFFTQEFLETKQFKKIDKVFKFYIYTTPFVALLGYDNFAYDLDMIIYFVPLAFFVIFVSFYALYKGVKQARFYVIGWSIVIFSLLVVNFKTIGLIDITVYFAYISEIAFVLEALLFSIALAHKIKILSDEKEESKNALIEFQQKEQARLIELVKEKTKDLTASIQEKDILYKELNHRVKNNLQMIVSLIRLQITNSDSLVTTEALNVTKNRVYSISNLYEVLYLQGENLQLDTLEYFKNIVSSIQTGCIREIDVVYDVRCSLNTDQLIYCGLIVNELVTNAYKYAFKDEQGTITISLIKKEGKYELVVNDNGVGFKQDNQSSLGLTIVGALVEKQLLGEIQITSDAGVKIIVTWNSDE
ncbi:MAG: 7TM diverse intracellular signaling domain-containing protein [Sulfurimonadaceae bacterium]